MAASDFLNWEQLAAGAVFGREGVQAIVRND